MHVEGKQQNVKIDLKDGAMAIQKKNKMVFELNEKMVSTYFNYCSGPQGTTTFIISLSVLHLQRSILLRTALN